MAKQECDDKHLKVLILTKFMQNLNQKHLSSEKDCSQEGMKSKQAAKVYARMPLFTVKLDNDNSGCKTFSLPIPFFLVSDFTSFYHQVLVAIFLQLGYFGRDLAV